ncbi:hypothetical protein GUJ93_ZPchr0001g32619 [Zizania palustris]|uniref:DUF7595 domain-containing protein n=1 Tax=Zizania palustris TaxID=103762 RepID=A0A8J5SHE7_ZIZPA|nr:hypothetical protein GUJ93_ZPchr0001g32619 [Zizania palustris]
MVVLPDDLVLEIIVRSSSAATIVRCAAVSRSLRRRILHPAFVRRLRGVIPFDDGADGHHGFIPSLLLGLYHRTKDPCRLPAFVPAEAGASIATSLALASPETPIHGDNQYSACVFSSYLPVASRRSLLVLRRRCKISSYSRRQLNAHGECPGELTVCNPVSGERWVLPPHEVFDQTIVVLDVNHDRALGSHSFKLLAADLPEGSPRTLIVQVFSSDEREWSPPLTCPISRSCNFHGHPKPVVLRSAVHWLCFTFSACRILKWERRGDGAEPKASLMKLPPSCESGVQDMCLALSTPSAADGTTNHAASLSVLVHGCDHIAVWVRTSARRRSNFWEQRHVIREDCIARPMEFHDGWLRGAELGWFCEGSGALILVGDDDPLLLDLPSMAVNKIKTLSRYSYTQPEFLPYETDLISYMMFLMKTF